MCELTTVAIKCNGGARLYAAPVKRSCPPPQCHSPGCLSDSVMFVTIRDLKVTHHWANISCF